jgi:hypothetical protein
MNEKTSGVTAAVAHAAAAFAGTPFPYLLGLACMMAAIHWDGHLRDTKGCFQLQEIHGVVYKVDTCEGKIEAVKSDNTGSKASIGTDQASGSSAVPRSNNQ